MVLRSLKTIRKESAVVAMLLGRSTPDPRIGSPVELSGRDASGLLNLVSIGKTLPSEGISPEEAPSALLKVKPAGSGGNEDVMQMRMLSHPDPSLSTVMAAEIIRDNEDVACQVVCFDVLKQGDV